MERCQLIMEEQQLLIRHQAQQSSWAWLKRKKTTKKTKNLSKNRGWKYRDEKRRCAVT